MSSSPASTLTPVKRACDSCHRRKVRCIGEGNVACKNCVAAGLNCTYNAVPQKKGPKGSRAKVLSELRETQRQSHLGSGQYEPGIGRSVSPATNARAPGLVTEEVINACVEYFFHNLYPTQPILHRVVVQQVIMTMDQSTEAYCKIVAFCAYMLFQPNMILPLHVRIGGDMSLTPNTSLGHMYLEEVVRVRKGYEFSENPSVLTVYTSYFLFSCYFCLDRQNAAWVYLRQATTLAHVMGMHDESTYKMDDYIDASRKRRLFWVLFMAERAYAFKRHRPLSLYDTIQLPNPEEDPTESVSLTGFNRLIKLYKPFDETFFGLWNRTSHGAVPSWLVQLQQQLSTALPSYLEGTETQNLDLKVSQQWLKTMIWQLAISHGFISSMSSDNTLSFRFPLDVSRDLVEMSSDFSQHAMEIHGVGLVEKLFDVACTLIDVMSCVPLSPSSYEMGPREYLNQIVSLMSSLRSGQSRYLPMMQSKMAEVLPSYQLPIQPRLDVYGNPPQHRSSENTVYEPTTLAIRHNMPGMYQEPPMPTLPSHGGGPSNYNAYSPGSQFQEVTTGVINGSKMDQTHHPQRIGYPG